MKFWILKKPIIEQATLSEDIFMKMVRYATLAAALGFLGMSGLTAAQEVTLRASGSFQPDHSSSLAMERFRDSVAERTNGEVRIDLFPSNQLGGASQQVDQVRRGSIFMSWSGPSFWTGVVPEIEALSLPFVLPDPESAFNLVDGPLGGILSEGFEERNVIALGWGDLGARHVTNSRRALNSVEDFNGLRIRMQPNEVHLSTFRALGANPAPLDIAELFSALQQGVMDGQENPYSITLTNRFQEIQGHLSDTAHFYDYVVYLVNKEAFEGLDPEYQEAIRTSMEEAIEWQRSYNQEANEAALEELIEAGMTFTPISDELRDEMREMTSGVIDDVRARIGSDLVDMVLEEAGVEQ
ncbi:TRAP transporter substrate-binding protein [Billgrantia endophytica]|uniref:C4-dicarboxylate ABC transporter substrate-binding protein n=1 Tax=Billgrantia endophytica TaxID=2033802 RepID=A0A2N7UEH2_9GAMM|nr:TRAP transporter substrate-binding protein [Halomonas endophytica]PMR78785.1 C4-dicarboxylate ABC transporter substrate-binding protein [Halomonas endophytica]